MNYRELGKTGLEVALPIPGRQAICLGFLKFSLSTRSRGSLDPTQSLVRNRSVRTAIRTLPPITIPEFNSEMNYVHTGNSNFGRLV